MTVPFRAMQVDVCSLCLYFISMRKLISICCKTVLNEHMMKRV